MSHYICIYSSPIQLCHIITSYILLLASIVTSQLFSQYCQLVFSHYRYLAGASSYYCHIAASGGEGRGRKFMGTGRVPMIPYFCNSGSTASYNCHMTNSQLILLADTVTSLLVLLSCTATSQLVSQYCYLVMSQHGQLASTVTLQLVSQYRHITASIVTFHLVRQYCQLVLSHYSQLDSTASL